MAYFKTNAHRMRYAYFREQRMFIGSGTVEAGWVNAAGNRVAVGFVDDGARQVMVRDSKHRGGAALRFTESEWNPFVKGVRAGEFG